LRAIERDERKSDEGCILAKIPLVYPGEGLSVGVSKDVSVLEMVVHYESVKTVELDNCVSCDIKTISSKDWFGRIVNHFYLDVLGE
jgi:hypothetical protein